MSGLYDHDIVVLIVGLIIVLGRRVPLQMIAAHADLVAHEFVAELEGVQSVARDGAVA